MDMKKKDKKDSRTSRKKSWGKLLLWAIVLLLIFVFAPLTINVLFKYNCGIPWLEAEWEAADALSFYGTIVAAVVGIVGVFYSIQYAQKSYKEDLKNQVRPYFAITQLRGKSKYNIFWDMIPNGMKESKENSDADTQTDSVMYQENQLDKVYITIEESEINYRSGPTEDQKQLLKTNGFITESDGNGRFSLVQKPYMSFPMLIENVGNGPALITQIGFFKEGEEETYIRPIQMKKGDQFYIHIFSSVSIEKIQGKYVLSILYQDMYQNRYKQDFPYTAEAKTYGLDLDVEQQQLDS